MRASLDIPFSLGEIISLTDAFCHTTDKSVSINAITTDTREMQSGDLYIALPGKNFNGEDFCKDAEEAGCAVISTSYKGSLLVKDTKDALLKIAAAYKNKLKGLKCTVAITGSVGKSTTKEFLKVILAASAKVHATYENCNNYIGMSFSILTAPSDTEYLVLEMGTNHPGEISELSKAAKPDISVITKIGTSHIGNFGSRELIAKAKLEITEGMSKNGVALIPYGEKLLMPSESFKTVAIASDEADFSLTPTEMTSSKTDFYFMTKDGQKHLSSVRIFGEGNLRALAFSILCALEAGLSTESIISGISNISDNNTRQTVFRWNDRTVIDDSYNASFESVIAAFDFMRFYRGRRVAVLGDILELGAETEIIHFKIGVEAVRHGIEMLFLLGVYSPFIARGAVSAGMSPSNIFINTDTTDHTKTLFQLKAKSLCSDVILFKASHSLNFSELCRKLKITGDTTDVR